MPKATETRVGSYRLLHPLGKGEFGTVWLAEDLVRGQQMALKELHLGEVKPEEIERFKQEFKTLSELHHVHLAQVYDFGLWPGENHYFYTADYCPGKSLLEMTDGRGLDYLEAIFVQLLTVLDYLHSREVIHFDIKSSNILVHEVAGRPNVKLVDFGLATRLNVAHKVGGGTLAYMSPEVLSRSRSIDHRADLYSLGMLLARALSGRWPFQIEEPKAVMEWQLRGQLPNDFWQDNPPPRYLQEIVAKLIQKNPAERFSQARAVLNFLNLATGRRYQKVESSLTLSIPREGPLVGRASILETLKEQFRSLGSIFSIHGERGIGKTRLLEEFHYFIQLSGVSLYRVTAEPGISLFKRLEELLPFLRTEHISTVESSLAGEIPAEIIGWPLRRKVDALIQKARAEPCVLFIDDFHHADPDTREWVRQLGERLRLEERQGVRVPLLVVLTEEGEGENGLTRLEETDVLRYLQQVLPDSGLGERDDLQDLTKLLYRYSGGLPLLMVEGLRYLASSLAQGRKLVELHPPQGMALLYRPSWDQLTEQEREVVSLLAVAGRSLSEMELMSMTGLPVGVVKERTDRPIRFGLIRKEIRPLNFQISSQALALDLVNSLTTSEQQELHLRLAGTFAKLPDPSWVEIARHWEEGGNMSAAIDGYSRAGREFTEKGEYGSAVEVRLKALQLVPEREPRWDELALETSRLLISAARYREAEDWLKRLAKKAPRFEQEEASGWLALKRRDFPKAEQHYRRALELVPVTALLERILLTNALGNVLLQKGDIAGARAQFEMTLPWEAKLPLAERGRISNNNLGLALTLSGQTAQAIAFFEERLKLFVTEKHQVVSLLSGIGFVLLKANRYREAAERLQQALVLSEQSGIFHSLFSILGNLITAHFKEGRFAECLPLLKKMIRYQEGCGTPRDLAYNLLREGSILLTLGAEEAAEQSLQRGKILIEEIKDDALWGWFLLMEGYLARERSDLKKAKKILHESLKWAQSKKLEDLRQWDLYTLADIACEEGKEDEASRQLNAISNPLQDEEFLVRLELLKLKLKQTKNFSEVAERCRSAHLSELLWELHHLWGSDLADRGALEEARNCLRQGVEVIEATADSLPEEYRDRYRAQRFRRALYEDYQKMGYGGAGSVKCLPGGLMIQDQNVSVVLEINKRMVTERDPEKLLEFIMDVAIELSGAEDGLLLLLDAVGEFEVKIARNIRKEDVETVQFSRSIAKEVVQTGKPIFSLNIPEDHKLAALKSVVLMGLKTVACVPLRFQNRILGVVYLDTQQREAPLKRDFLPLLETFADQAALALQNAYSFQAKEQDRQRLEDNLSVTKQALEDTEVQLHELEATKSPRRTLYPYEKIIGRSKKMEEVLRTLDKITNAQVPVFIHGETGTGKELIARALHQNSLRKGRSFVAINCSAFTETILESELFGYLKGAFTGADRDRKGLFEEADGGTIFLDEIADMSLTMQAKILRVLQEQEVMRVGGRSPIKVQVRVVSASNKDLKRLVREGKFREDLYYRLAGIVLTLPPLRERKEDLPLLVKHFLEKIKKENRISTKPQMSREAMHGLLHYTWPGNIRELEQSLTSAALLSEGGVIKPEHLLLQQDLYEGGNPPIPPLTKGGEPGGFSFSPEKKLEDYEKEIILKMLAHCEGNKSEAARRLGVSRLTLHKKIRGYEIGVMG